MQLRATAEVAQSLVAVQAIGVKTQRVLPRRHATARSEVALSLSLLWCEKQAQIAQRPRGVIYFSLTTRRGLGGKLPGTLGTPGKPPLTRRLIIAAELRAEHPKATHAQLGRMCGISRIGFTMRLLRYQMITGKHTPRRHRFRVRFIRPMQLSVAEGFNRDNW